MQRDIRYEDGLAILQVWLRWPFPFRSLSLHAITQDLLPDTETYPLARFRCHELKVFISFTASSRFHQGTAACQYADPRVDSVVLYFGLWCSVPVRDVVQGLTRPYGSREQDGR